MLPFAGASGKRLALMIGAERLEDVFDVVNVYARWPGRQGKGSAFPPPGKRRVAAIMAAAPEVIVFAGKRVAKAFGAGPEYLRWDEVGGRRVAVILYPSGVNRWWNCPRNGRRAIRFLRSLAWPRRSSAR